ncbi:hypothetical protein GGR51DRAFT_573389 [Nemania sp. FL0031]|nr:hypothetical protein GGR51DRAFT_573389 [Nemania sp. FL0031]
MSIITPIQRQLGWNVIISTKSGCRFGGFYQQGSLLSVAEVKRELDLCFKFEEPDFTGTWQPALIPLTNAISSIFLENTNNSPFPTPWPLDFRAEYIYAFHNPLLCIYKGKQHTLKGLARNTSYFNIVETNAKTKDICIRSASPPRRRDDSRYLPTGEPPGDLLRTVSVSGGKRNYSAPDSASTSSNTRLSSTEGSDESSDGTFPDAIMHREEARPIIDSFRPSVIAAGGCRCAISKKGRAWWYGGKPIGSTIQPTHIIPPIHWSRYPNCDLGIASVDSVAGLRFAWHKTWQVTNGLLLASNLRECFDARLVSINPDTNRIRAFVPFDMITEFHNTLASIVRLVDRHALRHHYDMCCIENMTANTQWAGEPLPLPGMGITFLIELPPPSSEPQPDSGQRRSWRLGGITITDPDVAKAMKEAGWLIHEWRNDNEDEECQDLNPDGSDWEEVD